MSQVMEAIQSEQTPNTIAPLWQRLWQYQRERFPIAKHGMLIVSFSFCAVCVSALLRGETAWPGWQIGITAFICLLLFFLQLRIADEFKDAIIDAQYRPERPVPRGLVTLAELRWVGLGAALIQAGLAFWLHPLLLLPLVGVWLYMLLMRIEFGASAWLQRHPFAYLWSHMLIVPLIDLFATACDWIPHQHTSPVRLTWFLLVSLFNGVVIEIGRKTWAPGQERTGVESYSSAWGIPKAVLVWFGALLATFLCALMVAVAIDFFWPVFTLLLLSLLGLAWSGSRFIRNPTPKGAAAMERDSGLWVAGLYLILGVVPMGVQVWF